MTTKELLLQEIAEAPESLLASLLGIAQVLKAEQADDQADTVAALLQRIDYLEAVVGIRKGLAEFEQGQGIPAGQAFMSLEERLSIPPRP